MATIPKYSRKPRKNQAIGISHLLYDIDCQYCSSFLHPRAPERDALWNTRIMETEHFVVVPTLGMLVPGWLLIITKNHYINMATVPNDYYSELEELKGLLRVKLTEKFNKPVFFEHGPTGKHKAGSCCIDHAHWHAVALPFDLLSDLLLRFKPTPIKSAANLKELFGNNCPYIYYENQQGDAYAFYVENLVSQFFRRLIAEKIGKPMHWDWYIDPGIHNIKTTISRWECKNKVHTINVTNTKIR